MENKIKLLAESLLFNGLPESMLQQLAAVTTERQFNRSEAVFFEGQAAAGFYLIKSGQVKIFKLSPEGKEQILHVFGRGEPFGEVPVFSGQLTFPANAVSLSASELLFYLAETQGSTKQVELDIPKGQLASLLGTSPETLSRIFNSMSAEGLIRVEGRRIELLRYEGLITLQD